SISVPCRCPTYAREKHSRMDAIPRSDPHSSALSIDTWISKVNIGVARLVNSAGGITDTDNIIGCCYIVSSGSSYRNITAAIGVSRQSVSAYRDVFARTHIG